MKISNLLSLIANSFPAQVVYAHCDIPCGIYDPHQMQIGVLTVIRMLDIMAEAHGEHDIARLVIVKEEHAEIVKREVRVIWGDYFKAEHVEKYPELHSLTHEIMQLASKVRQTVVRTEAEKLLDKVNRFAEIFWETKGKKTRRVKAPYKPEEEVVVPILD